MKSSLNVRAETRYFADLPADFEKIVAGRMAYNEGGDFGPEFYVERNWLDEAQPSFKNTQLYRDLKAAFDAVPEARGITFTNC